MVNKVHIIGVGDDGIESLGLKAVTIIRDAEILIGGERHLAFFAGHRAEKVTLRSNLKEVANLIKARLGTKRIVILASGDPNFYGIAQYLLSNVGKEPFEILPNVSSMQLAFARIKETWEDAALVSVHARPIEGVLDTITNNPKTGLITDDENTPAKIAQMMLDHGLTDYQAFVCENMGGKSEKITETDIQGLATMKFSPLNVLILKKTGSGPAVSLRGEAEAISQKRWTFGIPENEFEYKKPERGLITKTEVRVISLSRMALQEDSVVWDVGAGSGSVSIEAALLAPRGRVYAIEKDEDDLSIMKKNFDKFACPNITVVHTTAPDGLDQLEAPDAIFVGGSGGRMQDLLDVCWKRLKPGGRLVANLATIENLSEAYGYFKNHSIPVEVTLVSISRSAHVINLTRFDALHPVFIMSARK